MSASASCRCGPTSPRTRCPTTTPRRSSGASASTTRSRRPRRSASARRRRCGSSGAAAARAIRGLGEGARLDALAVVPRSRTATALPADPPPRALPRARRADLRDVRPRASSATGRPDRAAVVRRAGRAAWTTADARAAAHDDRVRRAVLEVRLAAPLRCAGRQSSGRHALPALRHVRDCRPPARRDRPRRPARSAGPTPARSVSRWSTSGEHYVVDLLAGLALAEGVRRVAPVAGAARRSGVSRARAGPGGRGARHERQTADEPPVRARSAPPRQTSRRTPVDEHARRPRSTSRAAAARCSALRARRRSPSSTSCCRRSPAWRTRGSASSDGRPAVAGRRARASRAACSAATSRSSAASSCARGSRRSTARELPDHDGEPRRDAAVRGRRRRRRRAHGLGAAALGMRAREVADQMIAFLMLLYCLYAVAIDRLRLRAALGAPPRRAPFAMTVVPAMFGAARDRDRAGALARPDRPAAAPRAARARDGRARRARAAARHGAGASRPGMRYALDHVRRRDPALLGAIVVLGRSTSRCCGPLPRVRRAPPLGGDRAGASSSGCSATCCRSRAASAASTAA